MAIRQGVDHMMMLLEGLDVGLTAAAGCWLVGLLRVARRPHYFVQ